MSGVGKHVVVGEGEVAVKKVLFVAAVLITLAGCRTLPRCAVGRPRDVKRVGMVVGIKPEKIAEYRELHANCWPGVLKALEECNIHNFSIYLAELEDGKHYLFGYLEYWGDDFEADMAKAETYDINKKWWRLTDACQFPVATKKGEGLWMDMEEVFHRD